MAQARLTINPHPKAKGNPRQVALEILLNLEQGRSTLDQTLERFLEHHGELPLRDRRLLHALVFGVLRWQGQLDWIIGQFSRTPIEKMDPPVRVILRLGLYQVRFMDRIPDSAAVHTAVELAKQMAPPWVVKFVNAVLRRAVREHKEIRLPDPNQVEPARALSVKYAFPKWMVARWVRRWGVKQTEAHCRAHNRIPPIGIRVNTLKTDLPHLIAALTTETATAARSGFTHEHLTITAPRAALSELDPFRQGWFQVQDEAAYLTALITDPQPGEAILDACAGLGGKTGALAQLMNNGGSILATDRSRKKLKSLRTEMQRLGVTNVRAQEMDLSSSAPLGLEGGFDRVLLDAPCSGLGVIRRNPDTKWRKSARDIVRHGGKQFQLLRQLASMVKKGGFLIYAVCSTEPEENEEVLGRFLAAREDFSIAPHHPSLSEAAQELVSDRGYLRTRPDGHGLDGFFAVKLKRNK